MHEYKEIDFYTSDAKALNTNINKFVLFLSPPQSGHKIITSRCCYRPQWKCPVCGPVSSHHSYNAANRERALCIIHYSASEITVC